MRRGFAAAVTAIVLGATVAGCGQRYGLSESEETGAASDSVRPGAAYAGLADVPERLEQDGTTITVGDPGAAVTVHLYEDPRCPVCEEFEITGAAPELRAATIRRETRTQYTLASFLDDRVGGSGSKKAVNALRAALEAGKFAEYHDMLYANQPEESTDGFTDAYLLELAGRIEGLRGPAFDSAVRTMKYRSFVVASEKAYERAGGEKEPEGPGTPTAVINDVRIPVEKSGLLYDGTVFSTLLSMIRATPEDWQDVTF